VQTGRVERTVVGLSVRDATEQDAGVVGLKQITGVVVSGYTSDDSPAKQAGIRPGDVIVSLRREPVETTPQLQERLGSEQPGEREVSAPLRSYKRGRETQMLRLLFLLVSQGPAIVPTAPHSPAGDPPVRLWLSSHGDYEHGDRAKVHAQAAQDGLPGRAARRR